MELRPRKYCHPLACAAFACLMVPLAASAVVRDAPVSGKPAATTQARGTGTATGFGRPGIDYAADEVLVTFVQTASAQSSRNAVRAFGDEIGQALETRPSTATVQLESGRSVAEAVQAYEADPRVAHVQPNYIYRAAAIPDDTRFGDLWGLKNDGQAVDGVFGSAGRDIAGPSAWDLNTDCRSIRIAILDTGVNYKHADLAGNMWTGVGRDFVGDDPNDPASANDDDPMPYQGATHGSHVAGTVAAVGDNGQGTAGVCWQAEIMSVRVLGPNKSGFTSDTVEGVDYAVNNGARVINMSIGGSAFDATLESALDNARSNGVLVVAAAGNSGVNVNPGQSPVYPCSFDLDNIICVAALDQNYALAGFSNFGDIAVDVGAPGVNVLSTFPGPTIESDFSGWNLDAAWAIDTACVTDSSGNFVDALVNPSDWCFGGLYANGLDSRAYKEFDLSDSIGGRYDLFVDVDLSDGGDTVSIGHEAGSSPGDPFDTGVTDALQSGGDTSGFVPAGATVQDCAGTRCSIGVRLVTDGSGTDPGVAAVAFELQKVVDGATANTYQDGTSMAAPHVTGIAALAWSVVQGKDYSQIRSAVINSGDDVMALDTTTVTGRAVDAFKAIQAANDAPSAQDTSIEIDEGTSTTVAIIASDPNGHPLSYSVSRAPSNGTVTRSDNEVTYRPDDGFTGSDSFAVRADDGFSGTDTATVDVTVNSTSSGSGGGDSGGGGGALGPWPLVGFALVAYVAGRYRRARIPAI